MGLLRLNYKKKKKKKKTVDNLPPFSMQEKYLKKHLTYGHYIWPTALSLTNNGMDIYLETVS